MQRSLTLIQCSLQTISAEVKFRGWVTHNRTQTWEEMLFGRCVYGILRSELSGVVPPLLLPSSFLNFCSAKLVIRTMPPPEPPEDKAGLAVWDLGVVGAELGQRSLLSPPLSPSSLTPFRPPPMLGSFSGWPSRGHDRVVASQSRSMSE